jgi:hypothetical protein
MLDAEKFYGYGVSVSVAYVLPPGSSSLPSGVPTLLRLDFPQGAEETFSLQP